MASFAYLLLLLLLVTTFLSPAPALCCIDHGTRMQRNATKRPSAPLTYIVLVEEPPSPAYGAGDDEHRRWHESFLPRPPVDSADTRLVHSYTEVFNGFAARLTGAELHAVAKKPGFVRAFPEQTLQLMTTHTPEFLGLRQGSGFWSDAGYGKGVILGLLDSGVYAAHPSFDDHDIPPPPARWKGSCKDPATRCNNKLIGTTSFVEDDSIFDLRHGTHTSSTAAGNFVAGATAHGLGAGTAAGIAPGAHIAMYHVCAGIVCNSSAILTGLDAAIKDGVDVFSMSISPGNSISFDKDPVAIGAFSAVSKGIVMVSAAGNSGPKLSTISNDAPWMLTVAAGSVDRSFDAGVRLGNGKLIDGQALTQEAASSRSMSYPLLYSEERRFCQYERDGSVAGKVVVCQAKDYFSNWNVICDMKNAGAASVVMMNSQRDGYATIVQDYGCSIVQVTAADGGDIVDYATSVGNSTATVTFNSTLLGVRPAPTVASFSARGPSPATPGVLKPDVMAPV